jgi:hypothetical protein
MDLVALVGKSRKNIQAYVLLPPECKMAIDVLINAREEVDIPSQNKYVFARLNANTSISGTKEIREIAQECPDLIFPDRISATKLRKYIATVSQVNVSRMT